MWVKYLLPVIHLIPLVKNHYFSYVDFTISRENEKIQMIGSSNVNFENKATEIRADDQIIPALLTGSFNGLLKLRSIKLPNNRIKVIEKCAFVNLPSLRILDLRSNELEEIQNGVFQDLNIVKLDLSHNEIRRISENIFYNLSLLQVLDLSRNYIEILNENAFYKTGNLEQLDLSHNQIHYIPDYFLFEPFSSTYTAQLNSFIDLSHNCLTEIHEKTLKGINLVTKLLLNNNQILRINENAFQELKCLEILNLERNNLTSLKNGDKIIFKHLDSLTDLYLAENKFTDVSKQAFHQLPNLNTIDLSYNEIVKLDTTSFFKTGNIKYLDLSGNNISYIPENFFVRPFIFTFNSSEEVSINLSDNLLKQINATTFQGALYISNLILSHNQIVKIHYEAFRNLKSLRNLDLENNDLMSIYFADGTNSTEKKWLDKNMTSLKRVNLKHNKFPKNITDEFNELKIEELLLDTNLVTNDNFTTDEPTT